MFKAFADPVRLRLLSLIASGRGGEVCVCDLTGFFEVTGPTISHHRKALRQTGLIDCERRGTWVCYWMITAMPDRVGGVFAPAASSTEAATATATVGTIAAAATATGATATGTTAAATTATGTIAAAATATATTAAATTATGTTAAAATAAGER